MLDPKLIMHPRSSEWTPSAEVASYVAGRVRTPLSKEARSRLRSECPHPSLDGKVALTPELDPRMATFLAKFIKDPKKGIDRSWRACQDMLLDALAPLTMLLDMAQDAKTSGAVISPDALSGYAQRSIVFLGNANCALSTERRRPFLIKVDPKLGDLADSEAGAVAQGGLFGEPFIKELGKFVSTFTSLDKSQTSIKKVFTSRVFRGAGRGRGRSAGQTSQQSRVQGSRQGQFQSQNQTTISTPREEGVPEAEVSGEVTTLLTPVCVSHGSLVRVGGRVAEFLHVWQTITSDAWVLQTVPYRILRRAQADSSAMSY